MRIIRLLIKVAIAALIANAAWRFGTAYASLYKFEDAAHEAVQFGADKSEDQLRRRILDLAAQFDLPVREDNFTIRRDSHHTYMDGSYTQPIQVLPGYPYPWTFTWKVDVFTGVL